MSSHQTSSLTAETIPAVFPALRDGLVPLANSRPEVGRASWSGMMISVADDLTGVEAEWRAFQARADGTVFQTFDWLSKWQQHIGAAARTKPAIVIGRDATGETLFLFPLAVEPVGPFRRLTWLGAALCDYNGPLLAPGFAERIGAGFPALWRQVLGLLRAHPGFRFDFVDLSKMLEKVGSQRNPFFDLDVHPNPSGAYVATLGDNWDGYYAAKRSGSTRKKERKQLKQLGEHGGEVHFVEVKERSDVETSMATLIVQKSHSFARLGVRNNFVRPGFREFYLDLTTDPRTRNIVHVSRLDAGGTIAAASLGLRFGDYYYLVLSSYQDGELARFGPGRAHLNELLRWAIGAGVRHFDFTIGDEPYKRDWSDIVLRPYDHVSAVTFRGEIVVSSMVAFRVVKRFIKQSPILWRTFSKVRSLRGALFGGSNKAAQTPPEPPEAD